MASRFMEVARHALAAIIAAGDKVSESFAAMTRRQQLMHLKREAKRAEKRDRRAEYRANPGVSGYCCPRCHEWYGTPAERAACKAMHRQQVVHPVEPREAA